MKALLILVAGLLPHLAAGQLPPGATGEFKQALELNELAEAQFKQKDFAGAETSYLRLLVQLEDSESISSPLYVAPLAGLAAVYAAQGNHRQAIDFFHQAIATNRRAFGLFNPVQTNMLEALAESYMALGLYPDAETQHRYIVQIAGRNFGAEDSRTFPALWRLGQWYESVHNYLSARLIYARIYEIARRESGGNNPTVIESLLAIGRMYRMQFWDDPELAMQAYAAAEQVAINPLPGVESFRKRDFASFKMDRNGQRALQRALEVLEKQDDPPAELMMRTLIELGDWYMASRQPDVAIEYYGRAAKLLEERAGDGHVQVLGTPRLAVYHAPPSAITYRLLPREQVLVRQAKFTLTVDGKGATTDIVLNDSDMTDMQAFQLRQAIENARYSPRFEAGLPAATTGVEFTGQWYDRVPAAAPDPPSPPAGGN